MFSEEIIFHNEIAIGIFLEEKNRTANRSSADIQLAFQFQSDCLDCAYTKKILQMLCVSHLPELLEGH